MSTKCKSNAFLAVLITAMLAVSAMLGFVMTNHSAHAASVANNPMSDTSFNYAPTIKGPQAATGDYWNFYQFTFDKAIDFAQTDYLAVEYRADQGGPGLTMGLLENGDRYIAKSGSVMKFMDRVTGNITDITAANDAINIAQGSDGMILMPIASMGWQWNNSASDLTAVNMFYITTNSMWNWCYTFTIGSIGVFHGDPTVAGTAYEKLLDVSGEKKEAKYYFDQSGGANVTYPEIVVGEGNNNPMEGVEEPFKYAPTITGATAKAAAAGDYEYFEITFDKAVDFAQTDVLAVQIYTEQAWGFTCGLVENGDRYATMVDGNKLTFVEGATGDETEMSVLYTSINLPVGKAGTLLIPMNQLAWQWNNNGSDLTAVNKFYMTTDAFFNFGFSFTIGEIGVFHGDPKAVNTTYEKLLDLSETEKKSNYYVDSNNNPNAISFPSDSAAPVIPDPEFAYPIRAEESKALTNGAHWYGAPVGDSADNFQTLTVKFDVDTVDLSTAKYFVFEYFNKAGNPGLTYFLMSGNSRYGTLTDDEKIYGARLGETPALLAKVKYAAVNAGNGFKGIVIIPMAAFNGEAASFTAIDSFMIETNSKYNYQYETVIGEVGYIDANDEFHLLLDLDDTLTGTKNDKFTIGATNSANMGTLDYWTNARRMKGDSTIDFRVMNTPASAFMDWDGGAYGSSTIVKDSYGENALQVMTTGPREGKDPYAAITLAGAGGWSWAGRTGVSFWARNDSDVEVAFNIEVDCRDNTISKSDRFNIKQGNRFFLYDVNTGKTTIYMTRPTATLPVGFEGWVYIPFTAFARADWSTNGVTNFMGDNTEVSYLAVTIFSTDYTNKAFSLNNFGSYLTMPTFESAYVTTQTTTIPTLLDLPKEA